MLAIIIVLRCQNQLQKWRKENINITWLGVYKYTCIFLSFKKKCSWAWVNQVARVKMGLWRQIVYHLVKGLKLFCWFLFRKDIHFRFSSFLIRFPPFTFLVTYLLNSRHAGAGEKWSLNLKYRKAICSISFSDQLCPALWIPWIIAQHFSLSMEFSRQKYWNGLPFPPPGDVPDPGIEPTSLVSLHWQADSLPLSHQGSPYLEKLKRTKGGRKRQVCVVLFFFLLQVTISSHVIIETQMNNNCW